MASPYDRLAQFYEWEHRDFREDLSLYLAFARASTGPILDAACGAGRLLIPLAEAGYSLTGVDSSQRMLELARSRLPELREPRRVHLVQGDLRTLELGDSFGMALVALGSFHHLMTAEDQRRALRSLAKHLKPGGLLLIDLVNPTPEWLAAGDGALVHQLTAPFPGPEGPDRMSKFVARTTRSEDQTEQSLLIYDQTSSDGAVTRHEFEMETRYLFRYEAEMLVSAASFRLRDIYGGYGPDTYRGGSPRMILVAERR